MFYVDYTAKGYYDNYEVFGIENDGSVKEENPKYLIIYYNAISD